MSSPTGGPGDHRSADDLIELILGGPRRHTRDEAAAQGGLSVAEARSLWRGMGFADVGDARAFTDADIEGLDLVVALVRAGHLDPHTAVDVARAFGQTAARLADWQVGTFSRLLTERGELDPTDGIQPHELDVLHDTTAALLPGLERLLVLVWRRHLAAAVSRAIAEADAGAATDGEGAGLLTVGFADLVGFTRLARRLPAGDLADLVQAFESVSSDVVAMTGARLVKTLGDEVLFVAETPVQAVETALRLHEAHGRDDAIPELRVGLSTGPVVARMGDVFGTTVNLAARLTALATPGTTWCDQPTAEALTDPAGAGALADRGLGVGVESLGPRDLRGLGVAHPYEITVPSPGAAPGEPSGVRADR